MLGNFGENLKCFSFWKKLTGQIGDISKKNKKKKQKTTTYVYIGSP